MKKFSAVGLLLMLTGIVIAIFIFTQGTGFYNKSKGQVEAQGAPSIECIGYIYSIIDFSYETETKTLSVFVKNLEYSDEDIHNFTISSDINQSSTFNKFLTKGGSTRITLKDFALAKNFTIYPEHCKIYEKTCVIDKKECIGYEPGFHPEWQ